MSGHADVTGHSSSSMRQPLSSRSESWALISVEEMTAPFGPAPPAPLVAEGAGSGDASTAAAAGAAAGSSPSSSTNFCIATENFRPVLFCCMSGHADVTGHSSSSMRQPLSSRSESWALISVEEMTAPFGPPAPLVAEGAGSGADGMRRSTSPSSNSGTVRCRRRSASVGGAGAGAGSGRAAAAAAAGDAGGDGAGAGAGAGASVAFGASSALLTAMLQRTDHVTPSFRRSGKPEIGQCSFSIVQPPSSRLDISAYASFSGRSVKPMSSARSSGLISEPIEPSAASGSIHSCERYPDISACTARWRNFRQPIARAREPRTQI